MRVVRVRRAQRQQEGAGRPNTRVTPEGSTKAKHGQRRKQRHADGPIDHTAGRIDKRRDRQQRRGGRMEASGIPAEARDDAAMSERLDRFYVMRAVVRIVGNTGLDRECEPEDNHRDQ